MIRGQATNGVSPSCAPEVDFQEARLSIQLKNAFIAFDPSRPTMDLCEVEMT